MIQARLDLDSETYASKSNFIVSKLKQQPEFIEARAIGIYVSFRHEVETISLIKEIINNKIVCVPKISGKQMDFYQINSINELKTSNFGILEPNNSHPVTKDNLDLLIVPMIYESISEMFPAFYSGLGEIGVFVKENFNYDISSLMRHIQNIVNAFFKDSVVLDTTIDVLNQVMINVTNFLIYIILAIYMSSNFKNIRSHIRNITYRIDKTLPIYLREIDSSLVQYVKAFFIGAIAQAITTMLMYLAIGHPNWLILGFVSGASSIIPYVGPIVANCLGLITSLGMGTTTIVILFILIFIQSTIMSYVITPRIYSSRIDLSIMWVLFGILSGSSLFGIWGMVIAMPLLVSAKITFQVYKENHQNEKLME